MPIPVVEFPGNEWTDLPITVEFAAALTREQKTAFELMVSRWYEDGTAGAFGGPMHSIEPIGFHIHRDSGQTAEWIVDMGDSDDRAIHELAKRIDAYTLDPGAKATRIILGWIAVD